MLLSFISLQAELPAYSAEHCIFALSSLDIIFGYQPCVPDTTCPLSQVPCDIMHDAQMH